MPAVKLSLYLYCVPAIVFVSFKLYLVAQDGDLEIGWLFSIESWRDCHRTPLRVTQVFACHAKVWSQKSAQFQLD